MFWSYAMGFIGWLCLQTILVSCFHFSTVGGEIPASLLYSLKDITTVDELMKVIHVDPHAVKINSKRGQDDAKAVDIRVPPKMKPIVGQQSSEESGEESEESTISVTNVLSPLLKEGLIRQAPASIQILTLAEMPPCAPRPTVVELPPAVSESIAGDEVDTNAVYWPPCVTLNRCGGCCSTELLQCESNNTVMREVQVLRLTTSPDSSHLQLSGVISLPLIEDESCTCGCRLKPEDCHPTREVHRNCNCECAVEFECPAGMIWDSFHCDCVCNAPINERTCRRRKHYFNDNSCGCECLERLQTGCQEPNTLNPHTCKCQSPRTKRAQFLDLLP